jgi:ribonuclease P/MRP protein subunit RPP40
MLDKWTKFLEEGGQIDVIYTDFEKAFDKVSHTRLIAKMQAFGFSKVIVNWIKSFLTKREQCVRVNGKHSQWMPVLSGIPQGTILGPLLFLIYINDLPNICEGQADMYLFADDAKLFTFINSVDDCLILQKNLDKLQEWSEKWLLKLSVKKCNVISISKGIINKYDYFINVDQSVVPLGRVDCVKDLGIALDEGLKFTQHMHDKINKAYSMLGIIKRNFKFLSVDTFVLLYKAMVRSHLDYCSSVWAPYKKKDIDALERVQKRATKLIKGFNKLTYYERLKKCCLPTLTYRRHRGDMIETFKILSGVYDSDIVPKMELSLEYRTRGNSLKLKANRSKYDLRKYFFTNRVVNIWNSLPDAVVLSKSVNFFKNNLDKFWSNQDVLFHYRSDLTGIGSRSIVLS